MDSRRPCDEQELRDRIARDALATVLPCTVPILGKQNGVLILNGSGVLLRIGDKRFLITAAHVLDFATIHRIPYYVGAWEQGARPVSLGGMGVVTSAYPASRSLDDRDMRDDDPFDVGVAILTPETVGQLSGRRFLNQTNVDGARRTLDAQYFIVGFPVDLSPQPDHDKRVVSVNAIPYFTKLFWEEPKERHRNADILLGYGPGSEDLEGNPIQPPNPQGISGCGIWRVNDPTKPWELWTARDLKLVGIEHRQCSSRGYLVGSWIAYALDLIFDEFRDLRPILGIQYSSSCIIT